jgi:hypothetical protein
MIDVVYPGTSTIHADTFARALEVGVGTEPLEGKTGLMVGVSPNPFVKACKEKGMKMVGYWIGTDSYQALHQVAFRKNIDQFDVHICVHERIQKELEVWGIKAHVVWPCARNYSKGLPPATEKLVGVYMPEPTTYMFEECIQVARENTEIPFVFYGAMADMGELPPNCKDGGRMSPEETASISDRISVMLRLVRHDGNPVGGIECKQRNRHIIENYPYDGFLYARTMADVNKFLRDDNVHFGDYGPWPSLYRERCSSENFKKEITACL